MRAVPAPAPTLIAGVGQGVIIGVVIHSYIFDVPVKMCKTTGTAV